MSARASRMRMSRMKDAELDLLGARRPLDDGDCVIMASVFAEKWMIFGCAGVRFGECES